MESNRPENVSRTLVGLLADNDLDGVMDLYEEDALFIEVDGVSAGAVEIRSAHQRFVDAGLKLELRDSAAFQLGDLALVHWRWTVRDRDGWSADGASAEVLRKQADGSWKFVIDNSDGAAVVSTV